MSLSSGKKLGQAFQTSISINDSLDSYYLNSKYSDLCIICGSESFPAHQNIVCAQSKYFEVACQGAFEVCLIFLTKILHLTPVQSPL